MYWLLNGNRTPFLPAFPAVITHTDKETALLKRIGGDRLPAPAQADGRLAEVVLKACAYNPKDRYSSPLQMRGDLEAILYNAVNLPPVQSVDYANTAGDMTENHTVSIFSQDETQPAVKDYVNTGGNHTERLFPQSENKPAVKTEDIFDYREPVEEAAEILSNETKTEGFYNSAPDNTNKSSKAFRILSAISALCFFAGLIWIVGDLWGTAAPIAWSLYLAIPFVISVIAAAKNSFNKKTVGILWLIHGATNIVLGCSIYFIFGVGGVQLFISFIVYFIAVSQLFIGQNLSSKNTSYFAAFITSAISAFAFFVVLVMVAYEYEVSPLIGFPSYALTLFYVAWTVGFSELRTKKVKL